MILVHNARRSHVGINDGSWTVASTVPAALLRVVVRAVVVASKALQRLVEVAVLTSGRIALGTVRTTLAMVTAPKLHGALARHHAPMITQHPAALEAAKGQARPPKDQHLDLRLSRHRNEK